MAHGGRYQYIDGGNRLQCQCLHVQLDALQGGMHGVNDLPWQEGGDDSGGGNASPLAYQGFQLGAVQLVFYGAVAYAVVVGKVIHCVGFRQLCLGCLHSCKVQGAFLLAGDDAAEFHLGSCCHGVEGTACSCYGSTFQRTGALDQCFFYVVDDCCHLGHIVNLAVNHGTGFVLLPLGGNDFQPLRCLLGYDADDAAGTDVQGKNPVIAGLGRRCLCRLGTSDLSAILAGCPAGIFSFGSGSPGFCCCGCCHFIAVCSMYILQIGSFHKNLLTFFPQKRG